MKLFKRIFSIAPVLLLVAGMAHANKYTDTINLFRNAGESASFFGKSYAYAVFPTVGEAGLGIGGALGKGHVYVHGRLVGDTTMGQVSVGFQAGGKAYSQIIFFEAKRALDEFESGSFEFAAGASAVAVTAGASASAGTSGASAGASAGQKNATATGVFNKGMAVFTIAKGGLMYAAAIAGQKFSYTPRGGK
ncbi:MAG: YSC84-related protein [Pseudomonadota bacterium]|nr:YSC84-related protein [Pseudomonadota bacterium]